MKNIYNMISCGGRKTATTLMLVAALLCAVSAYAGFNVPAGTYYFDNTTTNWDNVYLRIGKNDGSTVSVYQMNKVSGNANVYSYTLGGSWDGADAYQFAAYSGYTSGIYDGKWITAGMKSEYLGSGDTGNYLYYANNSNEYVGLTKTNMPSGIGTSYMVINNVWYDGSGSSHTAFNGANLGTFLGGSTITVGGEVTSTGTSSKVSATMNYCIKGYDTSKKTGTFATLNLPYVSGNEAKKQKSPGVSVTVPKDAGEYKFAVYFACGGVYDSNSGNNYVATYTVPGFTAYGASFGSVSKDIAEPVSATIDLTDVYGNIGNSGKVHVEISGDSEFSLSSGSSVTEDDITISSHAGSVTVYFKPTAAGMYEADLIFTLAYGDDPGDVITKTFSLKGTGVSGDPICHIGAEPTFTATRRATLNGYLQSTGCSDVVKRGFLYTVGASAGAVPSDPTTSSSTWNASDADPSMVAGDTWSVTTSTLTASRTYKYRAYVQIGDDKYPSDEIGTFTTGAGECIYQLGDTVYFTIDKALLADEPCEFKYRSIETAITTIKNSDFSEGQKLKYNVVFQVVPYKDYYYKGTTMLGDTTGGYTDNKGVINLPTILFRNINDASSPTKYLIVRSADPNVKPNIQHPTIRKSRNIIFDNVRIVGSPDPSTTGTSQYDNAMDIDNGSHAWHAIACGDFPGSSTEAGVVIKHCYIWSHGFTCVHISGFNGVTFEDNDIEADLPASEQVNSNTVLWGASVKMIQCKGFRFLRNNFRGSHATSFWVQGVRSALFMNNVIWNSNNSYDADYRNNNASIRLVTQFKNEDTSSRPNETYYNKNLNLGIYYNTFYFAENAAQTTDTRYMDFFRVGSYHHDELKRNLDLNDKSSIAFKYNNCYSYDEDIVIGANNSGNDLWCLTNDEKTAWCNAGSISFNNFWSMYDEIHENPKSVFGIPADCANNSYFINVKELVCSTSAEDPASLVLKGGDLNLGPALTSATDKSGLGAEDIFNDRLHPSNGNDAVRQVNGRWTLGAYQQSEGKDPITTIIWWGGTTGAETDWDNRNNWRKEDGTRVTCVDNIAEDVTIVIPAPTGSKYKLPDGGIKYYPVVPNKFLGNRIKLSAETVNAGQGIMQKPVKFANSIELEYGAVLKNVQSLKDNGGDRRYGDASNHLVAGRSEWILVGTVIKPFDTQNGGVRLVQSGDYFLNHLPHVYMRQAEIDPENDENVKWDVPFAQLDESVDYDQVFAIKLPDQYGPYKRKAIRYFGDASDATAPKTFNFNGWFLNDEVYPEYKVDGNTLLCNTLPANMLVTAAEDANNGSIKYYDYSEQDFITTGDDTKEVKSQNGFLFIPNTSAPLNDGYFRITNDILSDNSTIYKRSGVNNPFLYIRASNPDGVDGSSSAGIILDELKDDAYVANKDLINTTIANMPTKPEVYVMLYDKEFDKVTISSFEKAIPLGLDLQSDMTVNFSIREMSGIETAILEDRATGKQYDLLNGETGSIALTKGKYVGRFYLNLGVTEDISTKVDEADADIQNCSIDIYSTNSSVVVITSSDKVMLDKAYITDMSGRTTEIKLKDAHYNVLTLDGMQGVYIIKAVGDNMSKTEKVIVK